LSFEEKKIKNRDRFQSIYLCSLKRGKTCLEMKIMGNGHKNLSTTPPSFKIYYSLLIKLPKSIANNLKEMPN